MRITNSGTRLSLGTLFTLSIMFIMAGWLTSCLAAPGKTIIPTTPTLSPPPQTPPDISPTPPQHTPSPEISPDPDDEKVFLVVGIPENHTLNLYSKPSNTEEITGQIPAGSIDIQPLEEGPNAGENWIKVRYQDSTGWAERSHLALQQGSLPPKLVKLGLSVTAALREGDYTQLFDLIHPQFCLRFSPYPYLNETDQILCSDEISAIRDSGSSLFWGQYDGTGNPIQLTFQEYHERFVYDQDYFQPAVVGLDKEVSSGNSINNILDIYPDGIMVEYYFPGFSPQYGGMDWRSLKLVFINHNEGFYLVALVHGEWTI